MRPHLASPLSSRCDGDHEMSAERRTRIPTQRAARAVVPKPVRAVIPTEPEEQGPRPGGMKQPAPGADMAQRMQRPMAQLQLANGEGGH